MSETQSSLDLLRQALAKASDPGELAKATGSFVQSGSATTGLTAYDLEAPAKNLYPVLTPLRNAIPRVSGKGGIQANWKAVTAIDTGYAYAGVAEGRRGQLIAVQTKDYFAAYRTIGQEASATFEAELAAEGFDDLRARSANTLLQTVMIAEEKLIIGGNTSVSLGTTPTPTLTTSTTGGAIATGTTISVICVALSYEAWSRFTVVGGLTQQLTITPTDGNGTLTNGGGVARKSANATLVDGAGSTNSYTASVVPVRGAVGYAWYWGTAGSETLGAITTIGQVIITSMTTAGTQTAASLTATDYSTSALVFDGLLSIAANGTFGGYWQTQANGVGLTGDAASGIVEFDVALQYFWDNLRLSPSKIWVSSQEMLNIRKKIMVAGATGAVRFAFDVQNGQITGGSKPRGYLNPFTMGNGPAEIPIQLHPNLPPGTVIFDTDELPYPVNNVTNVKQIRCRKDYYQLEWPLRTRSYEYGVYSDEVLQHFFPPSLGVITNIANA